MTYKQESPFCIQVELTEGCNLRCNFCGLNGIRGTDNNFKFLTPANASRLAGMIAKSGWNPRIEFAMHGEPSANPHMIQILRVFRKKLPKHHLMMTSNGFGFLKDPSVVDAALEYLNVLAMDWYENVKIVPNILRRYEGGHTPKYYPADKDANPHRRRRPTERVWVVIQDISEATEGTHADLNNHAGCGSPKNQKASGKRCAKPFRELSVRWDGNVAVCCNDWRGLYHCGNVFDNGLEGVWYSPEMEAARAKLYHGQRDFGPCDGCDAISYRTGLLPDKKGNHKLPMPTQEQLEIIEDATSNGPYTQPVLRTWEISGKVKK